MAGDPRVYAFTAAASIRAVEEVSWGSLRGAFSPAEAFGADFVRTVENTTWVSADPDEAHLGNPTVWRVPA